MRPQCRPCEVRRPSKRASFPVYSDGQPATVSLGGKRHLVHFVPQFTDSPFSLTLTHKVEL